MRLCVYVEKCVYVCVLSKLIVVGGFLRFVFVEMLLALTSFTGLQWSILDALHVNYLESRSFNAWPSG